VPDLPEPYAADPKGWFVPPPYSRGSVAPGERISEGRKAFADLFESGGAYDRFPVDERRRLLLAAAATADATAAQFPNPTRYRTYLIRRAASLGRDLMEHDQEHGGARGRYPAEDPRWTTESESRREYVRQEWSERIADVPRALPAPAGAAAS
jgi:hypothetical protein